MPAKQAHEEYQSEERAHRTAGAAVKHIVEEKGELWEVKDARWDAHCR